MVAMKMTAICLMCKTWSCEAFSKESLNKSVSIQCPVKRESRSSQLTTSHGVQRAK